MALTEAVTYDNECSCALSTNCTTQAGFFKSDSSEIIPIEGFKMGCTPTESFLMSTLECFYNASCIHQMQEQIKYNATTNFTDASIPLSANSSQYLPNTTVANLVDQLFIETWSTTINYTAYFQLCSPTSCSYTYVQHVSLLYTVTIVLGLFGGLNFVLKWISPAIIQIFLRVYQYREKRSNLIHHEHDIKLATIETASAALATGSTCNEIADCKPVSTNAGSTWIVFLLLDVTSTTFYILS